MDSIRTFIEISMNWNPSYSYSKLPEGYDENEIPIHWKKMLTHVEPESKGIPQFKDITLANIEVKRAKKAINVNGLENAIVENITLKNVHMEAETAGKIAYSKNWTLENVSLKTQDNSKLDIENSPNVIFPDSLYVTY